MVKKIYAGRDSYIKFIFWKNHLYSIHQIRKQKYYLFTRVTLNVSYMQPTLIWMHL